MGCVALTAAAAAQFATTGVVGTDDAKPGFAYCGVLGPGGGGAMLSEIVTPPGPRTADENIMKRTGPGGVSARLSEMGTPPGPRTERFDTWVGDGAGSAVVPHAVGAALFECAARVACPAGRGQSVGPLYPH